MKLYFAGGESSKFYKLLRSCGVTRLLFSFCYSDSKTVANIMRDASQLDIFMDSGGYSARVSGTQIDIGVYIDCLHQLGPYLSAYANLDTDSPDESNANLYRLLKAGLKPVPVWHPGWAWSIFEDYCRDFNYVAIGGIVGKQKNSWKGLLARIARPIQYAFERGTRIHLFGVSSCSVLKWVPAYSCDATTWNAGGRFGMVLGFRNGTISTALPRKNPKRAINRIGPGIIKRSAYLERNAHNVRELLKMEEFLNRLWEKRGVNWNV